MEDSQLYAEMIQEFILLEWPDALIEMCHSGEGGVRSAQLLRPDLVITDFSLAGDFDGVQVARSIAAANPASKIILVTGHDRLRRAVDRQLFLAVLEKPFGVAELYALLRAIES